MRHSVRRNPKESFTEEIWAWDFKSTRKEEGLVGFLPGYSHSARKVMGVGAELLGQRTRDYSRHDINP